MSLLRYYLFIAALLGSVPLFGQLDSIHYLPPMHARSEWGPQFLYLSTPEIQPFPVTISDGQGNVLSVLNISQSAPARFDLGNTNTTPVMVTEPELHRPLSNKGLVVRAEKKYYAAFRSASNSQFQAGDLTCKGTAALGTTFRIGHLIQGANTSSTRANFIGLMAVEDSTLVELSGYDPLVRFRINGADTQMANGVSMWLMAGETAVFAQYITSNPFAQPPTGLIGGLLSSNKPIAVNTGSWNGSPVTTSANDIGIDQIAPFEKMGREYILCKGNGSSRMELPIVVAHVNNTRIWLNGNTVPYATLSAGQFVVIPTAQYSAQGNLYLESSEPVFVYQMIGGVPSGNDEVRTAGLIFVPPISCAIANAVDNMYQPNQIGGLAYSGGLMIVAMRDSAVALTIDGAATPLGAPEAVNGNPDFVTYRRLNLFSENNPVEQVSVVAEGSVQVGLFGRNGAAGYGAFFSGFSKLEPPEVQLDLWGDGVCPDTLVATGRFDGIQWYYQDSLLAFGPDTFWVAYAPGVYTARAYLGVCRRTDFAEDTLSATFRSPEFPYALQPVSCFGLSNGAVAFGSPSGGLAPYQYSVNGGSSFSNTATVGGLAAGAYSLVVRDSTGCYNAPLAVEILQPDSLGVHLSIESIQEPVRRGDPVGLSASPTRPVSQWYWQPVDTLTCGACTDLTVYPATSGRYEVVATDANGCTANSFVDIWVAPPVYAPNVISSGQVGNDRFLLFSSETIRVVSLRIYDRWGGLVFENNDFMTNDVAAGWDGGIRGQAPMSGVYFYKAILEYGGGKTIEWQGDVTVLE